jgi:hypothetical protein
MGSIAVDKGIAKLGSPADFYHRLDPETIAEHILDTARDDIREVVDRIMAEYPDLERDAEPGPDAVHARVEQQLPDIVRTVGRDRRPHRSAPRHQADGDPPDREGADGEPDLLEVGRKGSASSSTSGSSSAPCSASLVFITEAFPLVGAADRQGDHRLRHELGALWMIFEPSTPESRAVQLHDCSSGANPVSEVYGEIIRGHRHAQEHRGRAPARPRADRTRQMIEDSMRPAVDRAAGPGWRSRWPRLEPVRHHP